MSLEQHNVIGTANVKSKLQQGGLGSHLDTFCRLLADRLNEEINPLGFLMAFEMLVSDLEKGNGITIPGPSHNSAPIRTHLSGMPLGPIYHMALRKIAEHCLPENFAHETMREWHSVLAEAEADIKE